MKSEEEKKDLILKQLCTPGPHYVNHLAKHVDEELYVVKVWVTEMAGSYVRKKDLTQSNIDTYEVEILDEGRLFLKSGGFVAEKKFLERQDELYQKSVTGPRNWKIGEVIIGAILVGFTIFAYFDGKHERKQSDIRIERLENRLDSLGN